MIDIPVPNDGKCSSDIQEFSIMLIDPNDLREGCPAGKTSPANGEYFSQAKEKIESWAKHRQMIPFQIVEELPNIGVLFVKSRGIILTELQKDLSEIVDYFAVAVD